MTVADAAKMDESRGYRDIDPENCWYDWQHLRAELGRTPALPAGLKFSYVDGEDPEIQKTVRQAQQSLDQFRQLIETCSETGAMPSVKTPIIEGGQRFFMWLCNIKTDGQDFLAEFFEVPTAFRRYKVGDQIRVAQDEVTDWMVNENGFLHGGFSIRLQRSRLPESERSEFDEFIGATRYV
jgi:uncharacterized protein YegJ (DUF2314 family)